MSRKNSKPLKDSEIESQLAALFSSEEEEGFDDDVFDSCATDFYSVDYDRRLDEIQNLTTEDLHSILLGESDFSSIQDETHITSPVSHEQQVQESITIQEFTVPETMVNIGSIPQDVTMVESQAGTPLRALERQAGPSSLPLDERQAGTASIPNNSLPGEQNHPEPKSVFCRDTFSQLQNKARDWSFTAENINWPSFHREMQVKKLYTNRSQPLDYFIDYFPEDLIDVIVENTNIYAHHKNAKSWKNVTKEEIKAYFGMIILMSINPLSDITTYWPTDEFYRNPVISKTMPLKRFKKITQNLHISNIITEASQNTPNYDKLSKIRPAIEVLNKTFKENVRVSEFNSIDESMIRFKGRSHMKQYMPKKPIKRGYKCWVRADSRTGYMYEFQFYTGRIDNGTEENLGARVVMDLCESLPGNTLVAFDNFLTSLPLMEILHEKDIYSVGTIRINRKGLPDLITGRNLNREEKKETSLKPGEFIYQCAAPISVVKWRDTKDVFVASSAFDPRAFELIWRKQKDGSKKPMFCPLSITKYTQFMGGVDHFDHYRASYPLGRKSRKNWHRLFWFLLEAAVINAYIVYMMSHSTRRNTHKDFRLRLGRGLINNFSSRKCQAPVFKTKKGGVNSIPEEVRTSDVGSHMPELAKFRRCRMCSTRAKEQRTTYICKVCKVPLCAAPCFYNFHTQ
ncbi:piggyBac transposable element-derived protein 4-like [Vanessa cardui]|uniref:piggyBac transposable element-derived protein 4-like n=1 Tax=Vanessa cardui TaxID=171605 RepID=UPI001F12B867|nr:piggyBac transposable element-derived protein 4-like [Vanessa cardui]